MNINCICLDNNKLRSKIDIIKEWYEGALSDDEAQEAYDRLLQYHLALYYADKENKERNINE